MSATRKRIREIRAMGWSVEHTGGNHLRCTHPRAARPVYAGLTPSDVRAWRNMVARMRRALLAGRPGE